MTMENPSNSSPPTETMETKPKTQAQEIQEGILGLEATLREFEARREQNLQALTYLEQFAAQIDDHFSGDVVSTEIGPKRQPDMANPTDRMIVAILFETRNLRNDLMLHMIANMEGNRSVLLANLQGLSQA